MAREQNEEIERLQSQLALVTADLDEARKKIEALETKAYTNFHAALSSRDRAEAAESQLAALAAPVSENHEPTASQRAACLFAKTQADASGRPQSEVNAIVRESLINMAAKDVTPGAEKEEDQ